MKVASTLASWEEFKIMAQGIWDREYYTNHGPLVSDLEKRISSLLGVKHTICMTNSSIALMIAIKALEVTGKVLVPSFSHVNISQSVKWAGHEVEFCNPLNNSFNIDIDDVIDKQKKDIGLLIAVNDFGFTNNINKLEELSSQYNFNLLFISNSFFDKSYKGKKYGDFGDLEIFSFHESQLVNGADGACVCTSNDVLADRLRNIRSSYGAGKKVPIPYTGNGRMSEIQAGLILLSLDRLENNKIENERNKKICKNLVDGLIGLEIHESYSKSYNFILIVDFIKLAINLEKTKQTIQSINKHIEFFHFYGQEISFPFHKNTFNNELINNAIGIPSNITIEQFSKIISVLINK